VIGAHILPNRDGRVLMAHNDEDVKYCKARGVVGFLGLHCHRREPHPMSEGEIHYGECFVRPDPFVVKNCAAYTTEQLDRLHEMLRDRGAQSFEVRQIEEV
jgi:hypothetical protein